jgi:fatty acid desaturase
MQDNHLKWYNKTLHQYFSNEEIKTLMQKSDLKAVLGIATTWGWIAFALALAGLFPNPLTIIIALFIIGGKQLGCAIILHDCSHDSLFTSRKVNRVVGNWFGAFPILHDVDKYRPYHLQHHINTGLSEDPDLSLTKGYPTTALSMARKFMRDLLGLSGAKANLGVVMMQAGFLRYALNGTAEWLSREGKNAKYYLRNAAVNLAGPLAANVILFCILYAFGKPWLYLLWVSALFTTFSFSLRVRSMAEHSMVDDPADPQRNTRTTYANFMERVLFAPHHVNYHSEHHLCMGAPSYNLPAMHRLLLQRGFYKNGSMETNYWKIVKKAIVKDE